MRTPSREPAAPTDVRLALPGRGAAADAGSAGAWPPARPRPALIELARDGDRDAFQALIEPWVEPAFRTAMAILGNEADARDATQDALLHAWRGIRGLHDTDRFDAWLGRIQINACRSIQRRRGRSRVREIPIAELPDPQDPPSGAVVEESAGLDELERAFGRLPVEQRSILTLHHLEHRTVADMARVLRVPEGTVKWRLHAAREALARSLEEERR